MKNESLWRPSKFVKVDGQWRASRDQKQLNPASRHLADMTIRLYSKYLEMYARGRLLDLGCGQVPMYELYRHYVTENVCLDWGGTLHGRDFVDIECDLAGSLPLPDREFDTILCSDVIEHLCEPDVVWAEMSRILHPGGVLLLNTPFLFWLHEQPHDYFRYTEFSLKYYAEKHGFNNVEIHRLGGPLDIVWDVMIRSVSRVRFVGPVCSSFLMCAAQCCRIVPKLKRLNESGSSLFPQAYFLVARKA